MGIYQKGYEFPHGLSLYQTGVTCRAYYSVTVMYLSTHSPLSAELIHPNFTGVLRHVGAFNCLSHSWVEPSSQVLGNYYLWTHAHSLGPCQLLAVLLALCLSWVQDVPELLSHLSFQELTYFLFLHLGLFPLENAVWWITIAVVLEMNTGWKASFTADWLFALGQACRPLVLPFPHY